MTTKMLFGSAVLLPVLILFFTTFTTAAFPRFSKPDVETAGDDEDMFEGSGHNDYDKSPKEAEFDRSFNADSIIRPPQVDGPTQKSPLLPQIPGNAEKQCTVLEFRCVRDGKCIREAYRCDRTFDCPDHSDEEGCPPRSGNRPGTGPGRTEVMDPDYSTERKSVGGGATETTEQRLNLKTYPPNQNTTIGQQVAIQCRDEGLQRARVHWIRKDGAPLPPGSTDVNGRLEIPNVQVVHGGNYVCEALGVPANAPGRRVISHLTVKSATITAIEFLSKAVEKKLDRIDDLIETVQRMKDAFEKLTTGNELLTQEVVKLRGANARRNQRPRKNRLFRKFRSDAATQLY